MLSKTGFAFASRNSPLWLEKRQELNVKSTQLSATKDLILQSMFDVLQENGIHGVKRGNGAAASCFLSALSRGSAVLRLPRLFWRWQQGGQAEPEVHLCVSESRGSSEDLV